MTDDELLINGVEISPEGVAIGYSRVPADIRKNGLLWRHSVMVPLGSDYDDEIETFLDGLRALLTDVLEDEATAEPVDMEEDEEQEDEDDDE